MYDRDTAPWEQYPSGGRKKEQSESVVYVGGSADIRTGYGAAVDSEIVRKSTEERMAAFEQMLNEYFTTVLSL